MKPLRPAFAGPDEPAFGRDEPHGIKIAVQPRFGFAALAEPHERHDLPFHVASKFDGLFLSRFHYVLQRIKLVVQDDGHNEVLCGGIWRNRHYVPPQPSRLSREELAARVSTQHHTVDLLEHFPLPQRPATYIIYALLEDYRSNVVTLHVDVE